MGDAADANSAILARIAEIFMECQTGNRSQAMLIKGLLSLQIGEIDFVTEVLVSLQNKYWYHYKNTP